MFIAQNCLNGLYNLYSEQHPLSLDLQLYVSSVRKDEGVHQSTSAARHLYHCVRRWRDRHHLLSAAE